MQQIVFVPIIVNIHIENNYAKKIEHLSIFYTLFNNYTVLFRISLCYIKNKKNKRLSLIFIKPCLHSNKIKIFIFTVRHTHNVIC